MLHFQDATKLTDRLLELCNKNVDSSLTTLSISQNFKTLQRIISDKQVSYTKHIVCY